MLESVYQARLIKRIMDEFPGAVVLKTDPSYIQGFSDLLILNDAFWAALEVKPDESSRHQPNQDYWVDLLNSMSYANFIYPQNEERVLDELQQTFRTGGSARFSKRV